MAGNAFVGRVDELDEETTYRINNDNSIGVHVYKHDDDLVISHVRIRIWYIK